MEDLAERILFLKGDVSMVAARPVETVTDREKMLEKAAQMEDSSVRYYNHAAVACAANGDAASRQIFEKLVAEEEGHYDLFGKQLDNIRRFGSSYLALQSFSGESK